MWVRAAGVAIGSGVLGATLGGLLAAVLGAGFVVDWYVQPGQPALDRGRALELAVLLGAAVALVASPLASGFEAWARSRAGALRPAPRTPGTHALLASLAHGAALVLVLAAGTLAVLGPAGARTLDLGLAWIFLGGLGGAAVGAHGVLWLGRRVAEGKVGTGADGALAGLMLGSARHPLATLAVVGLVTAAMLGGLQQIETDVNVADVLPRGDPNTDAAHNLTDRFKSAFTQQTTLMFHTNAQVWSEDQQRVPFRRTAANPDNISDEVYIRALDQAVRFMGAREPFVGSIAVSDFYRLINWTRAGGQDAPAASFALPPPTPEGEVEYGLVHQGVWTAVPDAADAVISPGYRQTSVLLTVSPDEARSTREIGEAALAVRDAYVAWAEANPDEAYQVFTGDNIPLFTVELPVANAHASALAQRDFAALLPVIALWIAIVLFVAFRNLSAIFVAMSSLLVGTVWTFGAMGYLGIPLSTLNLTLVPLILGVGIDYSLHIVNEFQEQRAHGLGKEEAMRVVSRRAALALFVANLNTIAGLLVMVASPSLLIAQLGLLSAIAIGASYVLMVTFLPAALGLLRRDALARQYRPSETMAGLARAFGRHRIATLAVVAVVTVLAASATARLGIEAFGDPPRNWLEDDPLRIEHERGLRGFYDVDDPDVKANVLVFEGPVTTPEAHRYMDRLEASLRTKPLVVSDTLRTLPFLVRTWLTVKDGVPGAGGYLGLVRLGELLDRPEMKPYPATQAAIEAEIDAMFRSPIHQFAPIFIDHPRMGTAIMVFSVRADTYEDAAEVWDQVWGAVRENEASRPANLQVSFVGNTATNYLFIAKELPWLQLMSVVTNILVVVLVWLPTRDWRPAVVVGLLNLVTSIWWLAMLPDLGVGLAITLTLPLVFIYAIGSDYGLHLALGAKASGSMEETFRTTGKAVLFSAVILTGAFLIFTGMSNLAVRRTMLATAAAIVVMFIVTMLLVPALYKPRPARAPLRVASLDVLEPPEPLPLEPRAMPVATVRRLPSPSREKP